MPSAVVPLGFIGGIAFLAVAFGQFVRSARRRRWRDDIRPHVVRRSRSIEWETPSFPPNSPLSARRAEGSDPAETVIERWGEIVRLSRAYVRRPGQLRWHSADVFIVQRGQGLVVDPYLAWRRPYVFDDTCHIGPTDAVMTFNPGGQRLKDFRSVRVADATQTIELAFPHEAFYAVSVIGASSPVEAVASDKRHRIAFVTWADQVTARRRELLERLRIRSYAQRRVSSALCVGLAALAIAGIWFGNWAAENHLSFLDSMSTPCVLASVIAAVVYAVRTVRSNRAAPTHGSQTAESESTPDSLQHDELGIARNNLAGPE